NTLPVRLHLQAQQPLLPWLHALQAQQSEARQYEYSPLAQVQTCSQVPAGQPLFESLLVFENYPLQSASVEQMSLSCEQVQMAERTNYPLTLLVSPGPQILLRLSAQANRYSPQWSRRLLEHLQALLERLLSTSDQCLRQLAVLTEQEQLLLRRWNATNREEFKTGEGLHDVIERQVRQTPEAVALVCEEHWLTYDELNRQANRLAHRLRDWGVGPEVLVGICLQRSLELVIALLAVLKAGGAYVPLDPDYPQERLHYLLSDAQVAVLLTQHALEERLPPGPGRILWLDEPEPVQDLQAQQDLGVPVEGRQAVYMLYTSGSTGRPKGVKNEHAGLINRLLWMQEAYGLTPQDRVLQKTPVSFDVSVWEFFWPLQTGACLVLARPAGHREASYLGQLIEEQGVTTLHFVPSLLRLFLQEGQGSRCQSVRQVICSGEALPGDLQQQVLEEMAARLHNLYGPTEAAIDVTFWPCHPAEEVRIGWPISNTQIYLLDSWGQPVPIGQ